MLVWLWNFKDGGSKNARSLPKNQHSQRIFFLNNRTMNYSSSKSVVLSSLCQKSTEFFQKKNSFKNINFTLDLFALNPFKLQHSQFVSL